MSPHIHPSTNSSPQGTGRKINNFMGLAVLEAPEETVNNMLWMGGSLVTAPKIAHQAPACGEYPKTLQHCVILQWL